MTMPRRRLALPAKLSRRKRSNKHPARLTSETAVASFRGLRSQDENKSLASTAIGKHRWVALLFCATLGTASFQAQAIGTVPATISSYGCGLSNLTAPTPAACVALDVARYQSYGYTVSNITHTNTYISFFVSIANPTYGFSSNVTVFLLPILSCPINALLGTDPLGKSACLCNTGFQPDATGKKCQPIAPPLCPTGQVPHPDGGCMLNCSTQPGTHPNMKGTACVLDDSCPLPYVTPLPTAASDLCTAALEANDSASIKTNCPPLTKEMQNELACLKEKMATRGVTMQTPSATVRSLAYQRHFREIWKSLENLIAATEDNPALQLSCAARRAELAAEKGCDRDDDCTVVNPTTSIKQSDCPLGGHCLVARPASVTGAPQHAKGKAADLKGADVAALQVALQKPPPPKTVTQFLSESSVAAASVCPAVPKLKWGGAWKDNVHFYLP